MSCKNSIVVLIYPDRIVVKMIQRNLFLNIWISSITKNENVKVDKTINREIEKENIT